MLTRPLCCLPFPPAQVLEKTYYLMEEDYEPVLEKAEGSEIQWAAGKNVTVKVRGPLSALLVPHCRPVFA